jgi:hypothetical protein
MHLIPNKTFTLEDLKGIKLVTKDKNKLYWLDVLNEQGKRINCYQLLYHDTVIDRIKQIYEINNYTNKFTLRDY